jgi:hypothetical protein
MPPFADANAIPRTLGTIRSIRGNAGTIHSNPENAEPFFNA